MNVALIYNIQLIQNGEQGAISCRQRNRPITARQIKQIPFIFTERRDGKYPVIFVLLPPMSYYADPFDKLIASDQLSYLPNLYLRQYRAVDELVRLRQDFPEQRVLLARPSTRWDALLDEMRFRFRVVLEEKKYRTAQRASTARQLKLDVQRAQLREQENYHFHRLTASYLADAVHAAYSRTASAEVPMKEQPKEEEQKAVVKQNQDDIFVQGGDDYYDLPEENNLLDDLLNDPIVEKKEEQVQEEEAYIEPISVHLAEICAQRKDDPETRLSISRKGSLRRINESVRRRLKIREEEEEQPGRSLSSATVFLSNLLNTEPQAKGTIIELPSSTEWLFSSQRLRKRKEEEGFQLRWSPEELERLEQRNQKFSLKKGKLQSNVLLLSLSLDEEEYRRHFEKNITADRAFPPTLQNIPKLQIKHTQKYYNQFHDPAYESFIRRHNKRAIFQKFAAKAGLLFPESYLVQEVEDADSVPAGKIFIHPPEKVLDRLIYRIADYKLTTSVRSDFSHIRMDLAEMVILAFLAKTYLRKFGNDWRSVTQFIAMHPVFSGHHVTQELVQEVYQLVGRFDDSDPLAEINLWDKKILPFDYYGCYSYAQFGPPLYLRPNTPPPILAPASTNETRFDFDRYEEMLEESPEETSLEELQTMEEKYQEFARPVFQKMANSEHNFQLAREDRFARIRTVLEKFQQSTHKIPYHPEDKDRRDNLGKVLEELQTFTKGGDFKAATPFRKKKNINERNNELVKILQALRNKNVGVSNQNMPKKPEEATKAFPPSAPKSTAPPATTAAPTPAAKQQQQQQQQQPEPDQKKNIQKTPNKKLGGLKKDGKSKDQDKK